MPKNIEKQTASSKCILPASRVHLYGNKDAHGCTGDAGKGCRLSTCIYTEKRRKMHKMHTYRYN